MSKSTLTATLAVAAIAASAHADIYQMTFNGVSPSRTVSYSIDGGDDYTSTQAGVFNWTRTGGDAPGPLGDFIAFCIDLEQNTPSQGSPTNYTVQNNIANAPAGEFDMGATNAARLSELFGRYFASLDLANADQVAAFQIAVWECVYDSGVSLSSGTFRVQNPNGNGYYALAQGWLSSLNGHGPMATLTALTNSSKQDMIIPTPGTAALFGIGGLALARRRR